MPKVILYIIDDDIDDQEYLVETLKDIDPSFECITAINGQDGLGKLENNTIPLPSIIFLDLNMPRINGRQFLFKIKNDPHLKSIPIIIYTTSSNQKDIDQMRELGATDYLIKQSDNSVLKEKLNSILSRFYLD